METNEEVFFLAPMVCGLAVVVLSFMYGGGGCWDVAIFSCPEQL